MTRHFFVYTLVFMCMSMTACAQRNSEGKHYKEMVDSFAAMPPISSSDIVMLGDSHTECGGDWNQYFPGAKNIQNRGIIGDDARDILKRLSQVSADCPKAIFFECGANDLSYGYCAERVASDILMVVDSIRASCPNTRLFVQSVFPLNEDFGRWKKLEGRTDDVPVVNKLLKQGCKERRIEFIDLFVKFKEPSSNKMRREISRDGLHLKPSGFKIWAQTIAPYISRLNKQ